MLTTEKDTRAHILIIDDSTLDLRLLMEMMSTRKMRINVALNGNDGYHKATSLQPDLILLDITMPIMDGFTTCRWLKCNNCTRHIPVIFLSASNEVEKRIDGLSLGAVDFIGKPFNENEVMARIEIHLNLARQKQLPLVASKLDEIEQQDNAPCRDRELLNMATQYLSQHISIPPSQEALARILGTNEKRLKQAFHIGFSMPIFTWLREERLRQARNLLATTETPIADIAAYLLSFTHTGHNDRLRVSYCPCNYSARPSPSL